MEGLREPARVEKHSGPSLYRSATREGPKRERRKRMLDREEGVGGSEGDWAEEKERVQEKERARATLQEQRLKISINGRIVLKDNLTRG